MHRCITSKYQYMGSYYFDISTEDKKERLKNIYALYYNLQKDHRSIYDNPTVIGYLESCNKHLETVAKIKNKLKKCFDRSGNVVGADVDVFYRYTKNVPYRDKTIGEYQKICSYMVQAIHKIKAYRADAEKNRKYRMIYLKQVRYAKRLGYRGFEEVTLNDLAKGLSNNANHVTDHNYKNILYSIIIQPYGHGNHYSNDQYEMKSVTDSNIIIIDYIGNKGHMRMYTYNNLKYLQTGYIGIIKAKAVANKIDMLVYVKTSRINNIYNVPVPLFIFKEKYVKLPTK